MALKRASALGAQVWHTAFVANEIATIAFSALWLLGGEPVVLSQLWQPAVVTLTLFCGMALQLVALTRGDVSVTVPVLGLKVLVVAWATPFVLGERVRAGLWYAAFLSVAGITFLNWRTGRPVRHASTSLLYGGCAAICFGLFDVLIQKWAPAWGVGRLLPCVFWMNGLLSFACVPGFSVPLSSLSRQAWRWLIAGGVLLAAQSICFVGCLAVYGGATSANIVYSARGLLSVLLIWSIGHWFTNAEQALGTRILLLRLLGALFMLSAIVLVMCGW
jgi:drug/metabolite transporter (DMT)-like permease